MTVSFADVRLPEDVEQGAHGGPNFETTIVAMGSGQEQRNIDWALARGDWDVGYGISNLVDFITVRDFFFARRGRAMAFRFKDWGDFSRTAEPIGIGDGANKNFQLVATYEPGGPDPYVRIITRPVAGTINLYIDGVLQSGSAWSLGTKGLITFVSAPSNAAVVTADYEFDVPVRFNVDKYDLTLQLFNAGVIQSLPVMEIRE